MSNKNGHSDASIEELLAVLKHSKIPTVVTEGNDDVIVFRKMEQVFEEIGLSVFPVGGRSNVLSIFERRNELPNVDMVAFIVDQDTWIISGIPENYVHDRIIFTNGSSIENDVISDGNLEDLLYPSDFSKYKEELKRIVYWYALAVSRYIARKAPDLDVHPNLLLDNPYKEKQLISLCEGEEYPEKLYDSIVLDYKKVLRGKSLLATLVRNLSYPGRPVKHHHKSLLELVASKRGPLLNVIYEKIGSIFNVDVTSSA